MKNKTDEKYLSDRVKNNLSAYPEYPGSEDIYRQSENEEQIDPENIPELKSENETGIDGQNNEKIFADDVSGDDLDIPGAELDDDMESIGSEDEENNYYSLGGDNHNDLEEDKGD